ncbi:hypothetical protein SCP_0906270 [Sparassis crispa]|uniref:Uncharacterized protein n=1 Tax=Sparassis crispa TaxID=139825 RepID=A0A401GWY9_9APHY|nr:hypothetical protein SCP_0906270 [Sparassis crispa]GBE86746.1 hypothetical protein SCP_0906270 [Sparassis crispa]
MQEVLSSTASHPVFYTAQSFRVKTSLPMDANIYGRGEHTENFRRLSVDLRLWTEIGFDEWWRFAQDNDVLMIDEYDGIIEDLAPFWELPADELRTRAVWLAIFLLSTW